MIALSFSPSLGRTCTCDTFRDYYFYERQSAKLFTSFLPSFVAHYTNTEKLVQSPEGSGEIGSLERFAILSLRFIAWSFFVLYFFLLRTLCKTAWIVDHETREFHVLVDNGSGRATFP